VPEEAPGEIPVYTWVQVLPVPVGSVTDVLV
jgi:hypothetical protein